jgi:hypothetical protein
VNYNEKVKTALADTCFENDLRVWVKKPSPSLWMRIKMIFSSKTREKFDQEMAAYLRSLGKGS